MNTTMCVGPGPAGNGGCDNPADPGHPMCDACQADVECPWCGQPRPQPEWRTCGEAACRSADAAATRGMRRFR